MLLLEAVCPSVVRPCVVGWAVALQIDKVVEPSGGRMVAGGVSSEGVQRDLLPIIEVRGAAGAGRHGPRTAVERRRGCSLGPSAAPQGSVVPTKHGNVATDHGGRGLGGRRSGPVTPALPPYHTQAVDLE